MRSWLVGIAVVLGSAAAMAAEVLVWKDDFTTFDRSKWTPETGLTRNERAAQLYLDDASHVSIDRGALKLTATFRKGGYRNPFFGSDTTRRDWRYNRKTMSYASGAVNSFGKFSMRFGRLEVRARFNVASGIWPAIWLLGTVQDASHIQLNNPLAFNRAAATIDWPRCGEIDVMEFATRENGGAPARQAGRRTVYGTFHWGDGWQGPKYLHQGKTLWCEDLDQTDFNRAAWHTYGMEWTPEVIRLTFDGRLIIEKRVDSMRNPDSGLLPFREHYQHLLLNLALGGMANPPPGDGAGYPAAFAIDYVKVWQNPEIAGNGLRVNNRERAFMHLTFADKQARGILPEDARVAPDGRVAIRRAPLVIGGFVPKRKLSFTCRLTVPEQSRPGVLLAWRAGTWEIALMRTSKGVCRFFLRNSATGEKRVSGHVFVLPSGTQTLTAAYLGAGGVELRVNGAPAIRDEQLVFPEAEAGIGFFTLGGDASDAFASPIPRLVIHAVAEGSESPLGMAAVRKGKMAAAGQVSGQ